ncbi:MAG: hypothetical protein V1902_03030 [Candidatus Falkowbacteria bacterium]
MRKDGAFRALLDFARENPDCLSNQVDEMAEAIIIALADGGMHPRQLFARVLNSTDPNFLFAVVYNKLAQDEAKRLELLDAVVTADEMIWHDAILNAKTVANKFARAEDFEHLLKNHRDALLYQRDERPLFLFVPSDEYWRKRVRWYIAKRDWRRAWDEFRKARRGFFNGPKEEAPRFGKIDMTWYCYEASKETLVALIRELFNGMVSRGVFAKLIDSECVPSVEGAMAIKLTEYFREQRNAQRRKKWDVARRKV